MNDMDADGDEIPDFLDGFMPIGGAMTNSANEITGGAFVPLVVRASGLPAGAQLVFDYDANDPSVPLGNPQTISMAVATNLAEQCATGNPLPGRIRIWTKDASQHRNPSSVTQGGDFVKTNVPLPLTSLNLTGGETVLYVEGIGTSPNWGTDKIKMSVYTNAASQVNGEIPLHTDEVSYTVVRCVYKICVYRPYVCDRDGPVGAVLTRRIFRTAYDTPRSMMNSYTVGQRKFDDYDNTEVGHNLSTYMGHTFARVEIRTPSKDEAYWTGHTGVGTSGEMLNSIYAVRDGEVFWYRAADGCQDDEAISQLRYDHLYGNISIRNYYGVDVAHWRKLLAVREFRVMPETADTIHHFRTSEYSFAGYGLDVVLKGAGDSRSGCGSYIGLMTQRAGLVSPWDANVDWIVIGDAPVVPVGINATRLIANLGTAYGWYTAPQWLRDNAPMKSCMDRVGGRIMSVWNAIPETASWIPQGNLEWRQLRFFEPGKIADWIDRENASTPWQLQGLHYKDRGVDVRYDVPPVQDLNEWRQ